MALTWSTATDWDGAQSESNVVHESIGDHSSSDIDLGYPTSMFSNPVLYYTFHDSSGPLTDSGSAGMDQSEFGAPTYDASGILSNTSTSYDGTDDYHEMTGTDPGFTYPMSLNVWVYPTVDQNSAVFGSFDYGLELARQSDSAYASGYGWYSRSKTATQGHKVVSGPDAPLNTWAMLTLVLTSTSDIDVYHNGSLHQSSSHGDSSLAKDDYRFHAGQRGGYYFGGKAALGMCFDEELSSSQVSTLYDVTSGSLLTGVKTA